MKRKIMVLFLLLILAFGALAACSDDSDDGLVGRWESAVDGDNAWYVFREDGTGTRNIIGVDEDFTWEVIATNVLLRFSGSDEAWGFSIRRNTVTFTSDLIPGYEFPYNRAD